MKKNEERDYKTLFNGTSLIIFILDENKNVIKVNENIKSIGFNLEEIEGKNLFELPFFVSKESIEKLFEDKNKLKIIEVFTKDGKKKILCSILEEFEKEGKKYILVLHDITEEEMVKIRLKEEEDLLNEWLQLAEKSIAGIYIYDEYLNFLYVNPSFCNMLEYEREEIIGKKKTIDLVYDEDKDLSLKMAEERFKGEIEVANFYLRFKTKSGKIKYCYASGRVTNYKGKKVIMGTIIDVTERIEYEKRFKEEHEILESTLNGVIFAFSKIVEVRDPYTANHQKNVSILAEAIGKELGYKEGQIRDMIWACLLHDIGKISVPSEILVLPRRLTNIEFDIIKMHPLVGYNILKTVPTFENISKIILQHHERLDGSGYPSRLKGKEILKEARILGVADVVEAMISHRPYRPALTLDKALEEIYKNRGIKFDEEVVFICIDLFTKKNFRF